MRNYLWRRIDRHDAPVSDCRLSFLSKEKAPMRVLQALIVLAISVTSVDVLAARPGQTPSSASLSGTASDNAGRVLANTDVQLRNVSTGQLVGITKANAVRAIQFRRPHSRHICRRGRQYGRTDRRHERICRRERRRGHDGCQRDDISGDEGRCDHWLLQLTRDRPHPGCDRGRCGRRHCGGHRRQRQPVSIAIRVQPADTDVSRLATPIAWNIQAVFGHSRRNTFFNSNSRRHSRA